MFCDLNNPLQEQRLSQGLETIHLGPEYCVGEPFPGGREANGEMEMNAQVTKLQAAENDLKQLMADVARAVEKAQEAVARIIPKAVATTTETESTTSSR